MLKFIALIIPEPLHSLIIKEKELIVEKWGPKHALRTPPHLTIIPPIEVNEEEHGMLRSIARNIAVRTKSFQIEFDGYGSFKHRVIYLDPDITMEIENLYRDWRTALENSMPHVLKKYPDRPYHPHLTLAHRDVSPKIFEAIWDYYKDLEYRTTVTFGSFCILLHHDEGWSIEEEFFFNPGMAGNSSNGEKKLPASPRPNKK